MKREKKRIIAAALWGVLCLVALVGCGSGEKPAVSASTSQTMEQKAGLPEGFPKSFVFASGVGAWGTELTVHEDGFFEGKFHDSEMGESDERYPNGTVYLCRFSGQLGQVAQLDEYAYSMKLTALEAEEAGEEWIEDGIRYVTQTPYGLERGKDFVLFTPDTPVEGLDEEFLSWWPGRYEEQTPTTLGVFAIWNTEMGYGFFTGQN